MKKKNDSNRNGNNNLSPSSKRNANHIYFHKKANNQNSSSINSPKKNCNSPKSNYNSPNRNGGEDSSPEKNTINVSPNPKKSPDHKSGTKPTNIDRNLDALSQLSPRSRRKVNHIYFHKNLENIGEKGLFFSESYDGSFENHYFGLSAFQQELDPEEKLKDISFTENKGEEKRKNGEENEKKNEENDAANAANNNTSNRDITGSYAPVCDDEKSCYENASGGTNSDKYTHKKISVFDSSADNRDGDKKSSTYDKKSSTCDKKSSTYDKASSTYDKKSSTYDKKSSTCDKNSSYNPGGEDADFFLKFEKKVGIKTLERLLCNYAYRNEKIGYCQGLSFVAAILLLVVVVFFFSLYFSLYFFPLLFLFTFSLYFQRYCCRISYIW